MNNSIPYQVPMMGNPYHTPSNADNISTSWLSILTPIILNTLSQIVSQITLTRVIILILVLGNIKNVPFIWHVCIILSKHLLGHWLMVMFCSFVSWMLSASVVGRNALRSLLLRIISFSRLLLRRMLLLWRLILIFIVSCFICLASWKHLLSIFTPTLSFSISNISIISPPPYHHPTYPLLTPYDSNNPQKQTRPTSPIST